MKDYVIKGVVYTFLFCVAGWIGASALWYDQPVAANTPPVPANLVPSHPPSPPVENKFDLTVKEENTEQEVQESVVESEGESCPASTSNSRTTYVRQGLFGRIFNFRRR